MNSDIIKTDVTVVKFYKNYILAGIGNFLHIYQRCNLSLLFKKEIFKGQKIHGINCESKPLIIFGGRDLCTFQLNLLEEYNVDKFIQNLNHLNYDDWILDATFNELHDEIITISAHNVAISIKLRDNDKKWEKSCDINSILYGATIAKKNDEFFILAGTVFSEILIWSPKTSSCVLYRLTGHEGVIFSITWSKNKNIICSTSDDRSVRLWKVNFSSNVDNNQNEIKPTITMFGHTARVMRVKILTDCIISIGEDSLINIWDHNGNRLRKIESHQNDCIWSLDFDETYNQLITGGGDSGICLHSIKEDIRKNEISSPFDDVNNAFKKICFINESNIVIITELGTLLHYNCNSGIKVIAELKGFKKILFEVSPDRINVAVGGDTNIVFIYHLIKCKLMQKKTIKTDTTNSILSLHWLDNFNLLICDSSGSLKIGNINDQIFQIYGILPKTKERWTTAACKYKQFIIVGDRGGNIHLFELNNIHQSLHKIHGRLGITCLKITNSIIVTTGRDGSVKKFKINEKSKTLDIFSSIKIPFKWCANVIVDHSLVVGFLEFNFVIWSVDLHRKIFEYNCGGGHRSWDLYILDKNHFKFIFIKHKCVHEITFSTDNLRNLEQPFHSHEINHIVPILFDNNKLVCISGGEDTTLRVSQYSKTNFKVISTHNFHLSSVRCLHSNKLSDKDVLIFSGGGRAQLVLSKLTYENNLIEFDSFLTHSLKLSTKSDPETRIMDLLSFQLDNVNFILFVACSDGNLRVFRYKYKENHLNFIFSSVFHKCCITKLGLIKTERLILLSMGTNGKILFWDFSPLLYNESMENIEPFFVIKSHQSAINSFCYKKYNNLYLLATGGDDWKINLSLIEFVDELSAKVISTWYTEKYFCSQVTGLLIIDQFLFACSTDQRVTVCELIITSENDINCKYITQKCSTVSDLLGLCNFSTSNLEDYVICVYGKGMEVFRFDKHFSTVL